MQGSVHLYSFCIFNNFYISPLVPKGTNWCCIVYLFNSIIDLSHTAKNQWQTSEGRKKKNNQQSGICWEKKHFCSWRANIWRWLHLTIPVCLHVTVQRTDDPDWWSLSHLEKISRVLNTSLLSTWQTRDAGEQKKKRGREIKSPTGLGTARALKHWPRPWVFRSTL